MIRTVQVKDAGKIRDLCHQALGYDSTLEKVEAQIDKFKMCIRDSRRTNDQRCLCPYGHH